MLLATFQVYIHLALRDAVNDDNNEHGAVHDFVKNFVGTKRTRKPLQAFMSTIRLVRNAADVNKETVDRRPMELFLHLEAFPICHNTLDLLLPVIRNTSLTKYHMTNGKPGLFFGRRFFQNVLAVKLPEDSRNYLCNAWKSWFLLTSVLHIKLLWLEDNTSRYNLTDNEDPDFLRVVADILTQFEDRTQISSLNGMELIMNKFLAYNPYQERFEPMRPKLVSNSQSRITLRVKERRSVYTERGSDFQDWSEAQIMAGHEIAIYYEKLLYECVHSMYTIMEVKRREVFDLTLPDAISNIISNCRSTISTHFSHTEIPIYPMTTSRHQLASSSVAASSLEQPASPALSVRSVGSNQSDGSERYGRANDNNITLTAEEKEHGNQLLSRVTEGLPDLKAIFRKARMKLPRQVLRSVHQLQENLDLITTEAPQPGTNTTVLAQNAQTPITTQQLLNFLNSTGTTAIKRASRIWSKSKQ